MRCLSLLGADDREVGPLLRHCRTRSALIPCWLRRGGRTSQLLQLTENLQLTANLAKYTPSTQYGCASQTSCAASQGTMSFETGRESTHSGRLASNLPEGWCGSSLSTRRMDANEGIRITRRVLGGFTQ